MKSLLLLFIPPSKPIPPRGRTIDLTLQILECMNKLERVVRIFVDDKQRSDCDLLPSNEIAARFCIPHVMVLKILTPICLTKDVTESWPPDQVAQVDIIADIFQ